MAKKKILIRIGSLRHGGAEKVLVTFLKNLPKDQYDIDLLLNLKSGKYLKDIPSWINILYLNKGEMITTNRIQDIPIKAFRVGYQSLLKKKPSLLYKYILHNKKYDIEFAAIDGLADEILNSPIKSSKKIVWIHSDIFSRNQGQNINFRKFFKFDTILVISNKIYDSFVSIAKNQGEIKKIKKIHNPIDYQEIISLSKNKDNIVESTNEKVFLSVGTIYPAKGFDRLLRCHKRLLDEGYQHKLWIIGDGYDFQNIKNLVEELKVKDTVKLMGFKENPYPYFLKADYYILSSRFEGYPTVLFEALVLSKPIIATDVSGVREILNNGELGYIVNNDEDALYQGMKLFLENPQFALDFIKKINSTTLPFELKNAVESIEQCFLS